MNDFFFFIIFNQTREN